MASQLLPRSSIGGRVSSPFYFIKYVMYFDRPDQKQYTLQIKNKEGENVCVVEYLQAPMIEYSNFTQHDASDEIKILLRLKNFIEKHIKIEGDSIERTEAKRESISQYIIDKLDWSRIIDHIKATYFKERKSIYEGKDPYLFMEPPTVRGNGSF